MGAELAQQVAAGKTPNEAYKRAVDEAGSYYGHQEGYSGAINSKAGGFRLVELPPRMTYQKLQAILSEMEYLSDEAIADLRQSISWRKGILDRNTCKRSDRPAIRKQMQADEKALKQAIREKARLDAKIAASGIDSYDLDRIARTYHDKWDVPLAVELKGAEAKRYSTKKARGERLYIFFGYAPS